MAGKPRKNSSLQRFLLLVAFMSVSVPAVFTGVMLTRENYHRTVDSDASETARKYIELLEAGMIMSLWHIDPDLGQPLIDSISMDSSVIHIRVSSEMNRGFLSYESPAVSVGEPLLRLERDVRYDDEKLGTVELAYSLTSARSRAADESQLLLTILLTQLAVTILLVSYFLRRRVVHPLEQLETAAAGIAVGDLKTPIPCLKNDEFGALAKQLETMRGSLESAFCHLEDRVKERTMDLVDVNKELKYTLDQLQQTQGSLVQSEKLAALGSLVAGVAHELNTPIGNGLTVASSLQEDTRSVSDKIEHGVTRSAMEEYLADMSEGAQLVVSSLERASELVRSFKQVAMDRTSARRRLFELDALLRETRLTLSPAFKHKQHTVEIECDQSFLMDSYPGPLGQIITNLLNNALIHAFDNIDNGRLKITAELMDSEHCKLTISDNGIGIPANDLNRIFDPFFTTKSGEGGNGLGAHIVHNLVTSVLGGRITVASTVGEGTEFTIDLPRKAPTLR